MVCALLTYSYKAAALHSLSPGIIVALLITFGGMLQLVAVYAFIRAIRIVHWPQAFAWTLFGVALVPNAVLGLTSGGGVRQHLAAAAIRGIGGRALQTQVLRYAGRVNYVTFPASATDADLAHVEVLTSIWHLDLAESHVSDAGLVHLAGLTNLYALDLSGTQIGDEGLGHLTRLPRLGWLNLTDTNVTDEGVAELRKALPSCRIQR